MDPLEEPRQSLRRAAHEALDLAMKFRAAAWCVDFGSGEWHVALGRASDQALEQMDALIGQTFALGGSVDLGLATAAAGSQLPPVPCAPDAPITCLEGLRAAVEAARAFRLQAARCVTDRPTQALLTELAGEAALQLTLVDLVLRMLRKAEA